MNLLNVEEYPPITYWRPKHKDLGDVGSPPTPNVWQLVEGYAKAPHPHDWPYGKEHDAIKVGGRWERLIAFTQWNEFSTNRKEIL